MKKETRMPIILYIDGVHCTSLEQLRSYFWETQSYDCQAFRDLLDYARAGEIAAWLRYKGESVLASSVEKIDYALGDSDYYSRLASLIIANPQQQSIQAIEKPDFSAVFVIENSTQEEVNGRSVSICVHLRVLMTVNENYELELSTITGNYINIINSYNYKAGDIIIQKFNFPNKIYALGYKLIVDGKEVFKKQQSLINHPYSIADITYDKYSNILKVGDNLYKMQKVVGDYFNMGADEEQTFASSFEKPCYRTRVSDFLIMDSVVTQEFWEAVMGSNPSKFKGNKRPVTDVSYYECLEFIRKLNEHLKENFRLPKEKEWEYAARGGQKSNMTIFAGSNCADDVAWFSENSKCVTHNVRQKLPNQLGIYDMSGNVWEWCASMFYNYDGSVRNPKHSGYINRGGSAASSDKGIRITRRYYSPADHRSCFLGFRLVK